MASPAKKRTLSIGGATFDLFVFTDHSVVKDAGGFEAFALPLGAKIRVQQVIAGAGGGACNTSVGLSRLGCDAGFCGVVGDDQWGTHLQKTLAKEGVNARAMTVIQDETSSFSIILSANSGERVILYDPGVNAHLHDVTFDSAEARDTDWIYLNRIQEAGCVIENDLVNILEQETRPGLTWNPGGCHIDAGMASKNNLRLLARTDLLLVNKEEALAFTQKRSILEALWTLSKAGVRYVCITDGQRGAFATDGKTRFHCEAIRTNVGNTTGAGDAFGTGATWALFSGMDLPTALRAGTINAVSVVGAIGAQVGLLTEIEMRSKLRDVRIDVTTEPL